MILSCRYQSGQMTPATGWLGPSCGVGASRSPCARMDVDDVVGRMSSQRTTVGGMDRSFWSLTADAQSRYGRTEARSGMLAVRRRCRAAPGWRGRGCMGVVKYSASPKTGSPLGRRANSTRP